MSTNPGNDVDKMDTLNCDLEHRGPGIFRGNESEPFTWTMLRSLTQFKDFW